MKNERHRCRYTEEKKRPTKRRSQAAFTPPNYKNILSQKSVKVNLKNAPFAARDGLVNNTNNSTTKSRKSLMLRDFLKMLILNFYTGSPRGGAPK